MVSESSQEQEELKDELRLRSRELLGQNQKSQNFWPRPRDAGSARTELSCQGADERPGIGCEQVGRA